MASFVSLGSPWAFAPIGVEFALASSVYISILIKKTPRFNFSLLITSSALKLLAVSSVFTTNLNIFGLANLPFLLAQMLNEVTLLIWTIQSRETIIITNISKMYRKSFKALRIVGEIVTITVMFGLGLISPFATCPCKANSVDILGSPILICVDPTATRRLAAVLTPQIRGLAFVISITAGVSSISGFQFLVSGFLSKLKGREDKSKTILEDVPWKRVVRNIYTFLALVVALLFVGSYLLPGFRSCIPTGDNSEDPEAVYSLGAISSSLFNAMLAISQMFYGDMLFRMSTQLDLDEKEEEESSL